MSSPCSIGPGAGSASHNLAKDAVLQGLEAHERTASRFSLGRRHRWVTRHSLLRLAVLHDVTMQLEHSARDVKGMASMAERLKKMDVAPGKGYVSCLAKHRI